MHRISELDALRGIAALCVVIYHFFYNYHTIYGHATLPVEWSYLGRYGVQLFFILSGYVIFLTLSKVKKPMDFIISRFSRLYPAFWVSVAITFVAVSTFGLPGREVSLIAAVANLTMLHEYMRLPHVDTVYWTLTVELTFYFWMFLLFCINRLHSCLNFFAMLVILGIGDSVGLFNIPNAIKKIFIIDHISFFMAGICFYLITSNLQKKAALTCLLLSIISTFVSYSVDHVVLFLLFFVTFFLAVSGRLLILNNKVLIYFGGISYTLYLIHQNVGYMIIYHLTPIFDNAYLAIFLAICTSILLAHVLSSYFERPGLKLLREWYSRRREA
ncbi:acyltransferase family protein [Catenovulum agarivorans]|uniref:acyltransferase family protein n=1 Tax=Catenovulum agarivorans TaxID=1172192 RepID=UPI0002F0609B|nr:acyltransferase [Catenovulum agarivorans]